MGGKGSGPRPAPYVETTIKLPEMGEDEDSIRKYAAAVNRGVASGQIDQRIGEVLLKGANLSLRAVAAKASRLDIHELRDMLERAEAVVQAGVAHETAERQHMDEELPGVPVAKA